MGESSQFQGGKRLRADAALNRDRILKAARGLFAEQGIDVPMSAIARRAGVGVATLFRHFPNRHDLIGEAFADQVQRCAAVLDDATNDPDPWRGFCRLVEFVCMMQISDRGFTEAFFASFADEGDYQQHSDAETAVEDLVHRAQRSGSLRQHFAPSNFTMFCWPTTVSGRCRTSALSSYRADWSHTCCRRSQPSAPVRTRYRRRARST